MTEAEKKEREAEDLVEGLIEAYRPLVHAIARQLSPRAPRDEDLLQCGLIGLWRAAELWDQVRPFGPLARHLIRGEMVDYLRRQRRQPETVPLDDAGAVQVYEEDWNGLCLREAAVQSFPAGSRERALLLALCDGVSLSEAAKRVGVRRGRARGIARRAVRKAKLL